MADPSEKSLDMGMLLESIAGRTSSIHDNRCVQPPFGCGGDATAFRDEVSAREYKISGLCQTCQDSVFGAEMEEEEDNRGIEDDCRDYREDKHWQDLGFPGRYEEW